MIPAGERYAASAALSAAPAATAATTAPTRPDTAQHTVAAQPARGTGHPAAANILAADSVAADSVATDSVATGIEDPFSADRTLTEILFITPQEPDRSGPWRDTTDVAVFGRESVAVVPAKLQSPDRASLTENAVFQSFVLLLAAMYALLLYRNIGDIRMLFGNLSRESSSRQRLTEDPGNSGFTRFLHIVAAIGMLFLGIVAVKYGDMLLPHLISRSLPHGAVIALSLLATLACTLIVLLQALLLRTIGALTVSQPFISRLLLLRRSWFALTVLLTAPVLLLFALCPRNSGDVWFLVITIELAVAAVLYLRESLNLFISKKISILNWFLYLCTVEIFPFSLLWLLLVR